MSTLAAADGVAHELVGRVYATLRLGTLIGAITRRGDQVVITMSVKAYSDLVEDVNAARMPSGVMTSERLEVPE